MRLLVLGGTRFVGRALVETAVARGDDVTVLNRGITGSASGAEVLRASGAELLRADRTDQAALTSALDGWTWDAVVDTWSGAPRVVQVSARLLADRVEHFGYVSSRSVYRWPVPLGADESAPVVAGSAGAEQGADYAAAKRGGELAAMETFGRRALLARAGLVLGPYENVGRLVWWLRRVERGGPTLAPGPPDQPLQCIDARDLAAFLLSAADRRLGGAINTVSAPGHTTMRRLLSACAAATRSRPRFVWASPAQIEHAGIEPWTELPIWLPPEGEGAGMHRGDVSAALAAGLVCRPIEETVADTWAWMQAEGEPAPPADRPAPGLDPAREAATLAGF